jgi:hypothetical protein
MTERADFLTVKDFLTVSFDEDSPLYSQAARETEPSALS